ncbi:hypothetical protein ACJZ2D_012531 [Fusarium nematophilum]
MRLTSLFAGLLVVCGAAPTVLGQPVDESFHPTAVVARQSPVKPSPCEPICPPPSRHQTKKRFYNFAHAFVLKKDLTEAFTYIADNYTNHNPFADDGFDVAFDFLAPIWPTTNITLHRTLFKGDMGWLNYNASGVGEVIDRFRWEGGCIVEHWDVGEVWPL